VSDGTPSPFGKPYNPNRPCAWRNCTRSYEDPYGVPLCSTHYKIVVDDFRSRKQEPEPEPPAQPVKTVPTGPGSVYYIALDGLIKIGYSQDVTARMRAYPPTATLLAVEPGSKSVERKRHQRFGKFLAKGREWFTDDPELRAWTDELVAEHGTADHLAHRWGRYEHPPAVATKRIRNRRY